MRPMTLWESSDSTGEVSLGNLFSKPDVTVRGINRHKLSDIAFLSCRGGWPRTVDKGFSKSALRQAVNYFEAIVRTDISRVDNVERDEERTRRIMRSYARHQGTQASVTTILQDIKENGISFQGFRDVVEYTSLQTGNAYELLQN